MIWFYLVSVVLCVIAKCLLVYGILREGVDITVGDIVSIVFICLLPLVNTLFALLILIDIGTRSKLWDRKVLVGRKD